MTRYAIYTAPERDTRLWHFGNRVLGRDAETGEDVAQIVPDGFRPDEWRSLTESPRRYGFHATLKAPFRLKDGTSEKNLFDSAHVFAEQQKAIGGLRVKPVLSGGYVMLTTEEPDARVRALADACVSEFDAFRAPLTGAERERRGAGLTDRQKENLERWGYPHAFEDFMFHLTLAGPLPGEKSWQVLEALNSAYRQAVKDETLAIRSLCVFAEHEGAPFRLALRTPLGGA